MTIVRFVFRFIVFMVGISAIGVIIGIGVTFYQNSVDLAPIIISDGDSAVDEPPQNLEDVAIGVYLQSRAKKISTPLSDDPSIVLFTVEGGESALSIGERLVGLSLIIDAELFRRYVQYYDIDKHLEAGDYELRRNMSMKEIAEVLQKANFEEVLVTIPEGWRAEQVAEHLSKENIMDGNDFLIAVQQGTLVNHKILTDRPSGQSYEGYLFPDTYRLPINASPEDLIGRMLDNLSKKLPPDTTELATKQNMNLYQILTIASIVEREAVISKERPIIASVYINRIKKGMYLQADATVQYAIGYQPESDQWWKTPVMLEEYSEVNSPYNTYLNPSLPPGPIANPGIASIIATLQPAETSYLFYVALSDGEHVFAETYEEHAVNVANYQGR